MTALLSEVSVHRPLRIAGVDYAASKAHRWGTHRVRSPRATLDMLQSRMGEFGITRLADVTGLDHIGIPVYMSVRPNSRALSVSQGKGLDHDAAKASALMESIEGWHAERVERPLRYDSYAALRRSASVVDITRLSLQRGARLEFNTPRLWIEGFDLLGDSPIWVPFECVMTNFVHPHRVATTFAASSNGLAGGNHLLEATVHALCELLERDASAIWEASEGAAANDRRIDLATVTDPLNLAALERLRGAQIEVGVWDITSDSGIPAFHCRIFDHYEAARWVLKGIFAGQGCHLSAEVALLRAVTEAVQSRLTVISGSRDDMFHYADHGNPDDLRVALQSISDPPPARAFPSGLDWSTETFQGDVRVLLAALQRIGMEQAVLVDLTRPEIEIPVVRLIVPGLEDSLSAGWTPGPRARTAALDA